MYTVTLGPDTQKTFQSRKAAIQAARRHSQGSRHPVKVLREDGIERMVYHRGELTEAAFVTSDRRGRDERLR